MAKKSFWEVQKEIRKDLTARLVAAMSAGKVPWRRPWTNDPNCGLPSNVVSKNCYHGINTLLLGITALERGYSGRWWGTYRQWSSLGGQVKKRPADVEYWGTEVVLWKRFVVKGKDGEDDKTIPFIRTFTVFNIEQVEDPEGKLKKYRPLENPDRLSHPDYAKVQEAIDATGADIRFGGNRAFYAVPVGKWPNHTAGDYIQSPTQQQYPAIRDYYETLLHECIHWTEVRRGWDRAGESYAMGELVAEIGSAYLASALNVPQSDDLENHARYLQSWLQGMNSDPKFIFTASAEASKAADYILKKSAAEEDEEE